MAAGGAFILQHDPQKWTPLLRQDHAQADVQAHVLTNQVVRPERNMRYGMDAFCYRALPKERQDLLAVLVGYAE